MSAQKIPGGKCVGVPPPLSDFFRPGGEFRFPAPPFSQILDPPLLCILNFMFVLVFSVKVRLVGGRSAMEGRVEVFYNGRWGTVCDNSWDLDDATVVCRMLGYGRALGAPGSAHFGEGSGEIFLDYISCLGTEDNLATCRSLHFLSNNCVHQEDAGVVCENFIASGICLLFDLI